MRSIMASGAAPYNRQSVTKKICNTILDAIGDTPLVRLNRITKDVKAEVLVKVETFNPGNSIKDRMAVKMISGT